MPCTLPDAQPGVDAYRACSSQWLFAGMGGFRTGLRYEACISLLQVHLPAWKQNDQDVAQATGGAPPPIASMELSDLMSDLQIIEGAWLTAEGEVRDREKAERGDR